MADTCSITFNKVDDEGKVKVSKLWQDLRKEFKGDRQEAIVRYLTSQDGEFLENNAGRLQLDDGGEITIDSLKQAMADNLDTQEDLAAHRLNRSIAGQRFSYRDALNNALKFNRTQFYRRGGDSAYDQYDKGLMATINREENGKYSIVIVKRNNLEEEKLAEHVRNVYLTDALVELLRNAGLGVDFLEDSQAKVWFTPEDGRVEDGLKYVASVLQGEESSAEVAEVAGHFIVGAMRNSNLVQRLIAMFSATEEDVREGRAKLTGEQMQEIVFKSGTPETNPLYREDFDISRNAAVEAAGIVVGQQLLAPIANPYHTPADKRSKIQKLKSNLNPKRIWYAMTKLVERICHQAFKLVGLVNKYTVQEMIKEATDYADDVVYRYMSNEQSNRTENRSNFDNNAKQTYLHKSTISHLSQRAQDCAKAYYTAVDSLKSIAREVKNLLPRSRENAQNKEIFKTLKELIDDVRTGVDASLNLEIYAQSASRQAIIKALGGMAELLSGPVCDLLVEISSDTEIEDKSKTMKDYASMRAVIEIYSQSAMLLRYLQDNADKLKIDEPISLDGSGMSMTLRQAMQAFEEKLGDDREGGLPSAIVTQMRRMVANNMTEYYGEDYVNLAAARVWPFEAQAEERARSKGRMVLQTLKEKKMTSREFMDSFVQSLERDISWFDRLLSAADSADPIVSLGYKATRQANMRADRQAEKWWFKLEGLRAQMKQLFGTTDCSIFYEETKDFDEFGNRLTGNLLSADGILFGVWEKERHAYSLQLKQEFRDELEKRKQEFYAERDPDTGRLVNRNAVYYLSDVEQAALYHDFLDGKPITEQAKRDLAGREPKNKWEAWHEEHSIKDDADRWIPDPGRYSNRKEHGDKYWELFENPEISATVRAQRLQWYKQLLAIKAEMDGHLPRGATVNVRAPQITGRLVHRYRNLRKRGHGIRGSLRRAVCREMGDGVKIREDEAYLFGTNNEFNEIGEDPLQNTVLFEKDKRERIAFWGVNRLKDMSNLNTDLFSTLLNYGCMAATYSAMSSVVDIAELAKEVEARRTIGISGSGKEQSGFNSFGYKRYVKFLEKNVYGLAVTPPRMMGAKIALKMLRRLNSLGTWLALSGSAGGGTVNAGTGLIEVVKEALAGEHYKHADLAKAMGLYFKNLWYNIMQKGGHQRKTDQISLYIRHFNILSENKSFYKDQMYDKGLLHISPNATSFMNGFLMLPYRAGEHFMQCFPYLAMGYAQKYWVEVEKDGVKDLKQVSLMDLYKVEEGEDIVGEYSMGDDTFNIETGEKYPDRVRLTAIDKDDFGNYINPAFHSAESYEEYKTIQTMLNRIKALQQSGRRFRDSTRVNITDITKDERDVLVNNGLIESGMLLSDTTGTKYMLQVSYKKLLELNTALRKQQDVCVFTESDESAFMDLCRNMTNKLHGIYNMEDQNMLQQHWYMALLSGMRGYIYGMITNRFMPNRFSTIQKQRTEGYTNTALKTLWGLFSDIGNTKAWKGSAMGCAMSGFIPGNLVAGTNILGGQGIPFLPMSVTAILCVANLALSGYMFAFKSGKTQKAMAKAKYSEQQYRNIRRSGATYLWITGLSLLKMLLSPKFTRWDDDDDEPIVNASAPGMGAIYYLISRWLNEQEAFNNIHGFRNEANTVDWLPIGLKTMWDYGQIATLGIKEGIDRADGKPNRYKRTDIYYAKGRKGMYKRGDSKFTVKLMRRSFLGDIASGFDLVRGEKPRYVGRNRYVFEMGYDAMKSIDYNRQIAK